MKFLLLSITTLILLWVIKQIIRISKLPKGPFPLPFIGNLLVMADDPRKRLAALTKYYQTPILRLFLGDFTAFFVSDAMLAKEMYEKSKSFNLRPVIDTFEASGAVNSMTFCQNETWRRTKSFMIHAIFGAVTPQIQCDLIHDEARMLGNTILEHYNKQPQGQQIPYTTASSDIFEGVANVLTRVIFSKRVFATQDKETEEFKLAIRNLFEAFAVTHPLSFLPSLAKLGLKNPILPTVRKHRDQFESITYKLWQERSKVMDRDQPKDMLEHIIVATERGEFELKNGISLIAADMLIPGAHTTMNTIAWCLYELARNQDCQKRLREEFQSICSLEELEAGKCDFTAVNKLPYFKYFLKETNRCHPVGVFGLMRTNIKDEIVHFDNKDYFIPKGSILFTNHDVITHNPAVFENPDQFDVERWSRMSKEQMEKANASVRPFGHGPRSCAGEMLAVREVEIFVFYLIQKFHFELPSGFVLKEKFGLTVEPAALDLIVTPLKL